MLEGVSWSKGFFLVCWHGNFGDSFFFFVVNGRVNEKGEAEKYLRGAAGS